MKINGYDAKHATFLSLANILFLYEGYCITCANVLSYILQNEHINCCITYIGSTMIGRFGTALNINKLLLGSRNDCLA